MAVDGDNGCYSIEEISSWNRSRRGSARVRRFGCGAGEQLTSAKQSSVTSTNTSVLIGAEEQHYARILETYDHGISSSERPVQTTCDTPILPAK
jgi:hypothetical protein